MALNPNLLPIHFNDGGGSTTEQPLPLTPNVGDGNAVTNGSDSELSQSADQWLAQYISDNFKSGTWDGSSWLPTPDGWSKAFSEGLSTGALSANDVMALISKTGASITPQFEKYLNNVISQENAKTEYDREIAARDSSITSTLNQLRGNQMSTGLLSSLGGASAGISTSAAQADQSNISQARKMAEFNRKTSMAKTMLGILGGMASAGIYGGSMFAGRKAVAKLTTDASLAAVKANNATKLLTRRKGRSRFDGNGNFLYHDSFDY